MKLNQLERQIIEWGEAKGILPNPDPLAQWEKLLEEVNELKDALENNNRDEAIDAIGDIFVCVVMQVNCWDNLTLTECVQTAYDVISKRTGKMVDGQFVKDGE